MQEPEPAPPSSPQPVPQAAPTSSGANHLKWGPLGIVVFWLVVMGALYALMTLYLKPKPIVVTAAGDLVIAKAQDGHFYAEGTVAGQPALFMVDTGASLVTVSAAFASQAGLSRGVPTTFRTANGDLAGRIVSDVPVSIGPVKVSGVRVGVGLVGGDSDEALLGQSFLGQFDITVSANQMVLRPKAR